MDPLGRAVEKGSGKVPEGSGAVSGESDCHPESAATGRVSEADGAVKGKARGGCDLPELLFRCVVKRLWESFGEGTASWAAGRSGSKGLGFVCCLWRGESLICGSGKAGVPDGKSDRQLLAKKGSYIKVRQVMGLDNASLLFWVLRKTRKTARAVPAALGGVHE